MNPKYFGDAQDCLKRAIISIVPGVKEEETINAPNWILVPFQTSENFDYEKYSKIIAKDNTFRVFECTSWYKPNDRQTYFHKLRSILENNSSMYGEHNNHCIVFLDPDKGLTEEFPKSQPQHFYITISELHFLMKEMHHLFIIYHHKNSGNLQKINDVIDAICDNGKYYSAHYDSGNAFLIFVSAYPESIEFVKEEISNELEDRFNR